MDYLKIKSKINQSKSLNDLLNAIPMYIEIDGMSYSFIMKYIKSENGWFVGYGSLKDTWAANSDLFKAIVLFTNKAKKYWKQLDSSYLI